MSKFWNTSLKALVAVALLLTPALAKEPSKDDAVARVYYVDGKKLEYSKSGDGKWVAGKKDMAGFVKDHFRTDGSTAAGLELLLGGRVGLKKGSEIVLLSEGEAGSVEGNRVNKIVLNSGGAWAKFQKQDKPLTIQTRGGVMGIKGTEFTVETSDNGETEIVLLEGSVDYTDNNGESSELVPGQKLKQFEKDDELYVVKGEPSAVDKAVDDFLKGLVPLTDITSVQGVLNTNWGNIPNHVIQNSIGSLRSNAINSLGLPPALSNTLSSYVPGVPNWSRWTPDLSVNGLIRNNIRVPGGFPRF